MKAHELQPVELGAIVVVACVDRLCIIEAGGDREKIREQPASPQEQACKIQKSDSHILQNLQDKVKEGGKARKQQPDSLN